MEEIKKALCVNDRCKRAPICMRYLLIGNKDDTWIEFKPVRFNGKILCKHFIHAASEEATEYRKIRYGKTKAGQYAETYMDKVSRDAG